MCELQKQVDDPSLGANPSITTPASSGDPLSQAMGPQTSPLGMQKKTVPTKFGNFLKYALPAVRGGLYGLGTAQPTRALGGGSFAPAFGGGFESEVGRQRSQQMLQYQLGMEALDRQLRLATLQNTMRHQGALEDVSGRRADAYEKRIQDLEDKNQEGEWEPLKDQPLGQPPMEFNKKRGTTRPIVPEGQQANQAIAPMTPGGDGGASPALPTVAGGVPPGMFAGTEGGMAAPGFAPMFNSGAPRRAAAVSSNAPQNAAPTAAAAAGAPNAELERLNQGLADIYQRSNPGKTIPSWAVLNPGSTKEDFNRVKGMLDDADRATTTKAQRDTANSMRQAVINMQQSKQTQEDAALDVAAKSIAGGDLTGIKDISAMRGDQRLLLYSKIKKLAPNFNTSQLQRQIEMMDNFANKKQGDQLQSFGTFLEHAGALSDTMDSLKNTRSKILNTPLNKLRANVGDNPEIQRVLAALDPVQKEFESYLLNNRALYTEDRSTVEQIINGDLPPNKFAAALNQMGHTVQARYNEADNRFRNTMNGKSIEEFFPMTDEAKAGAQKIGLTLGKAKAAATGAGGFVPPQGAKVRDYTQIGSKPNG
jgi:hypothetical protein